MMGIAVGTKKTTKNNLKNGYPMLNTKHKQEQGASERQERVNRTFSLCFSLLPV